MSTINNAKNVLSSVLVSVEASKWNDILEKTGNEGAAGLGRLLDEIKKKGWRIVK
jgi:hypothetical protein